jgi:hypothetical protein
MTMTGIFMPRFMFDTACTVVTNAHVNTGRPIEDVARDVLVAYIEHFSDDGLVADWTRAVSKGLARLPEKDPTRLLDFFHHLEWYCMCFDDNGRYSRAQVLGDLSSQPSSHDSQRVERYLAKLSAYYVGLTSGSRQFPPAPEGWSLQTCDMWNDEVERLTSFGPPSQEKDDSLRAMLLQDFGEDFPIAGGYGDSIDDPIVFLPEARASFVKNEYDIVRAICIGRGVTFNTKLQTLIHHNGRSVDQIKIETVETSPTEIITCVTNYYFDVTDCMPG